MISPFGTLDSNTGAWRQTVFALPAEMRPLLKDMAKATRESTLFAGKSSSRTSKIRATAALGSVILPKIVFALIATYGPFLRPELAFTFAARVAFPI